MCDLYVHYRIASTDVPRLRRILAAWPEVRVLHSCDDQAKIQTWMEVHSGPLASRTEAALARALHSLIIGRRHRECFRVAHIGMPALCSEPPDHFHMPDAGLLERRAALNESGAEVEAHGG